MAKKERVKKVDVTIENRGVNPNNLLRIRDNINNEENSSKEEELEEAIQEVENDEDNLDDKEDNNNNEENNDNKDEENNDNNEEDNDLSNRNNLHGNSNNRFTGSTDNENEGNEVDPEENSLNENPLDEDNLAIKALKENEKVEDVVETVENIKKAAMRTKSVITFIIQLLINPLFWIALTVLFIGIYASSVMMIVGQNDYNILCDNMGVGSIMLDPNADDFTRQAAIASWFTSTPFEIMNGQPLTREQAIGIMGNLMQESYGANPKAIQNDHSITKWQTCNNECVLGWGSAGGKAIGIIQWDTGRRQELVKFAMSEGTQWHDLNTQLKFLKKEMDSGYEYQQLVKGGFNDPSKSMEDYVRIWNQYFERSAEAFRDGNNIRITYAQAFSNQYVGSGSSVAGGLANYCIGGMQGVDTSNLIQLAIAASWPDKTNARGQCGPLVNCGQDFSMGTYKETKILAENNSSKDPIPGLLASCDRYVATMYRASGKDINFPWGGANIQGSYMKNNPRWQQVSCQDRQPGDVLWRNGHVMLYLGPVNGRDSIGSASYKTRSGSISGVSCSGNLFVGDGDTALGFRLVN